MAIDVLQEKIRKAKNPSVLRLEVRQLPPAVKQGRTEAEAYGEFFRELLRGLKGLIPAVRVPFGSFALLGAEGMTQLASVLKTAGKLGYYVLLDLPELFSPLAAEYAAAQLSGTDRLWQWDGIVVSAYLGTDILRPFLPLCKAEGKDVFVLARSSNPSAPEIQDLLTGGRLVHTAVADSISRLGETLTGKYGYSQIALIASAASADTLRNLRAKYKRTFLLMEGYDFTRGNGKNCSLGFDRLGHGAAACVGEAVCAAWEISQQDYVTAAVEAAERMKRNLATHTTVL